MYEDDAVIAVDKPAGLAAVPVKGSDAPSVLGVVSNWLRSKRQKAYVVHRIDRYSSGLLLFAKTEPDREALIRQFLAHTPVREYLAVVRGRVEPAEGELVHFFRRDGMHQRLSAEGRAGATRAELRYRVEQPLRGACIVRVALVTGLQNQIRAQFAAMGHPVIGDRKYSPEEAAETRIARVALHAAHLEFAHPRSGTSVSIDCPPPADFQSLVRGLAPRRRG